MQKVCGDVNRAQNLRWGVQCLCAVKELLCKQGEEGELWVPPKKIWCHEQPCESLSLNAIYSSDNVSVKQKRIFSSEEEQQRVECQGSCLFPFEVI